MQANTAKLLQVESFTREANLIHELKHPHIVEVALEDKPLVKLATAQVIGVCIAPPALCLVLELCSQVITPPFPVFTDVLPFPLKTLTDLAAATQNLHQALQEESSLSFDKRLLMAVQCARATHFLHSRRPAIVHRVTTAL